jgi:outer membrane protein OmpA-like peptidoglycan-associated protein
MSKSPGVTKLSGSKIPNVTNPIKINQLESGKTYYFVVTVDNGSGESKESKELSYTAVEDKIGLIYWKNLFDKSIQDHKTNTAATRQEIKDTPERTKTETDGPPMENEAMSEKIAGDEKSSGDLAKERVAEPANIKEDPTENSKPATAHIETVTDPNLPVLEEMLLKNAQILSDSALYIFFEQNSNELSPKAIEKLDRIYEILANNSATKLTLNGYSDSSGATSYNLMVSEIRALSVKSYLSGKGIKPSRMMAFGHGAQKFIASNKSAEGRHLNRRVEIELIIP